METSTRPVPDIEQLRAQLGVLDFDSPRAPTVIEKQYFDYYSINMEDDVVGVNHSVGKLSTGKFEVACHYFSTADALGTSFVVHGYFDHAGLYGHLIRALLGLRQNVVVLDLPGHGLSTGPRASIEAFADYVDALSVCVRAASGTIEENHTTTLLGQSTGSAVIMQYLLDRKHLSDNVGPCGAVLLAPLVRPRAWAWLQVVHFLNQRWIESTPRSFSQNSHDHAFLEFLRESDPLQFRRLPTQWLTAMNRWIKRFQASSPLEQCAPLVIQGTDDGTVDWQFNIPAIQEKFPASTVQYIEDGRHHLVNESAPYRGVIFKSIADYMGGLQ